MHRAEIEERIVKVLKLTIQNKGYVSAIDILIGIGWLKAIHVQDWRKGKIAYLERVIESNLNKISYAMKCFRSHVIKMGLKASKTAYLTKAKSEKKELQFSKSGKRDIEIAYRTHYVFPLLSKRYKRNSENKQPIEMFTLMITKKSQCLNEIYVPNCLS